MSLLSDYQVIHAIGSGSFGTCYKVRHKHTNKYFVWKVIDYGDMSEEKKKLLVSEVNVLSELDSEYIVKYHDRIIDPDITTLYIIMEYCAGGDLASLIKKCKRTEQYLDERFIWKVLYQLSKALQVCHSSCILHRDIKPANVFLDENNNVKLGDFGLARILNMNESHSYTLVGTPYYMSPEVIKGGKYDLKSDIWALGCLLYELCSLNPPFHGDSIKDLFHRIPIHYSEYLHHIVIFMLSKNNETRPNIETLLQHPLVVKHTSFCIKENRRHCEDSTKPFIETCQVQNYEPEDDIYGTCVDNNKEIHENEQLSIMDEKGNAVGLVNEPKRDTNYACPEAIVGTGIRQRLLDPDNKTKPDTELTVNQISLIRQIFNSKMHMKNVMPCYSSEESIYMNGKSLLNTTNNNNTNAESEQKRSREDNGNDSQGNHTNVKQDKPYLESIQNKAKMKPYLETAIDEMSDQGQDVKVISILEENTNGSGGELLDAMNKDQIIACYQTLEHKINEILAFQNKHNSNHTDSLEMLLKEKLDRIRQHEAYIKTKEKQLQALEMSLNKREKCLAMQEKLVQDKIQRAQVYLKQCKDSRRSKLSCDNETVKLLDRDKPLIHARISKTSLPIRKSKAIEDNDSSFSADPGDTSILPTVAKIDPNKVKPIKYHRHVHFKDQFIELFNDIDEMRKCPALEKISHETYRNIDVRNNHDEGDNQHVIELSRLRRNDDEWNKMNTHTGSYKHQHNFPTGYKQLLNNVKPNHLREERKPLSNIFSNPEPNNNNMNKRISSTSGLKTSGFVTSTLNGNHSNDIEASTMVPLSQDNQIKKQHSLIGMKKHFLKCKSSQHLQPEWIRKSMKNNHHTISLKLIGEDKENEMINTMASFDGKISQDSNLKQLNPDNINIVRQQLQPLYLQNQKPKPKYNLKDVLKTRYDVLELSPVNSELLGPR
ncbi:hypothetical protein M8J76_016910 [Diaphorina citri]|nr:hypothetical protein M8J76_016910 [Diaphorina citri]